MKTLSLTALTIALCLILANLLIPNTGPASKPAAVSPLDRDDGAAAGEWASPSGSGAEGTSPTPAAARFGNQAVFDTLTPAAAAATQIANAQIPPADALAGEAGGGRVDVNQPQDAAFAQAPAATVPVSNGSLAEPVTVVGVPAVAPDAVETPGAIALPAEETAELEAFKDQVVNGAAGDVAGVFVPDTLALPVVQQPVGQANYVSTTDNLATQFSTPKAYGTIALLAHNYLGGRLFFGLKENQYAIVVYGDGREQEYRITQLQRFQALDPSNPYSNFIDLRDPAQTVVSAVDVFSRIYTRPNQLVFQTCIEANGDSSWGRLFVTAEKVGE